MRWRENHAGEDAGEDGCCLHCVLRGLASSCWLGGKVKIDANGRRLSFAVINAHAASSATIQIENWHARDHSDRSDVTWTKERTGVAKNAVVVKTAIDVDRGSPRA